MRYRGKRSELYIARYWDDPTSVGRGYIDITKGNNQDKENFFWIALNSDFMNDDYAYGISPDYWVSVISHEMLHNLGYSHPTGYAKSFINEFGEQIHADGTGALMLTNISGKKPMPIHK